MNTAMEVLLLALGFGVVALPMIFIGADRLCKICERNGVDVEEMLQGE